jgi:hypothetical protein
MVHELNRARKLAGKKKKSLLQTPRRLETMPSSSLPHSFTEYIVENVKTIGARTTLCTTIHLSIT